MPIRDSIEIARSPEDVFAYLDDLARRAEWQSSVVSARVHTEGPTRVGTRATELRRIGNREEQITYEITEHDPPRTYAFRGLAGVIRAIGKGSVEPAGDGTRARHDRARLHRPWARQAARAPGAQAGGAGYSGEPPEAEWLLEIRAV
jgi:hypothetical protein